MTMELLGVGSGVGVGVGVGIGVGVGVGVGMGVGVGVGDGVGVEVGTGFDAPLVGVDTIPQLVEPSGTRAIPAPSSLMA